MDNPVSVNDLLGSELRKQIYEAIKLREGQFTILDMTEDLNKKGIAVSRNMLQQFLQALVMRSLLRTHSSHLGSKRRGRYPLSYEMIIKK